VRKILYVIGGAVGEDEMKDGDPNQAFAGNKITWALAGRVTNLGRYKV
jgi:hypothetical protein